MLSLFHSSLLPLAAVTLFFSCTKSANGAEYKINDASDFLTFMDNVNNGITKYSGTTVYLEADLSLSEVKEPIGPDNYWYFLGTFDGQGHTISDLNINSSSPLTGLFGYSESLTIRNLVLDSSCSIMNSLINSNDIYEGSFIGNCLSSGNLCIIENSVNMASVTFGGNMGGDFYHFYLGGIAGEFGDGVIRNCANYGDVTHSGISGDTIIGGIFGASSLYHLNYFYNCLNYGTLTHNGTSTDMLEIGGIGGSGQSSYIENCVSAGNIVISGDTSASATGTIIGLGNFPMHIINCYVKKELNDVYKSSNLVYKEKYPFINYDSTTFELENNVSVGNYTGSLLIDALNAAADYYTYRGYSHWILNKEKKTVSFTINSRKINVLMNSQLILLPNLPLKNHVGFNGWYDDSGYTSVLTTYNISSDTDLYGKFEVNQNYYTVFFDSRGGPSIDSISAQFGTVVPLPNNLDKNGCNVGYWETEQSDIVNFNYTMPAHNITLYAVWKCIHIKTAEEFSDFVKIANSGGDYYNGITVFLESDISLSGKSIYPIGRDRSTYFTGSFDGKGHVISDLKMELTLPFYTGLFGYIDESTIRNVVLDSSCSITNSYENGEDSLYIGGIIGYSNSFSATCNIESNVNMASVTFNGNTSTIDLYIGGIVGRPDPYYKGSTQIINCVNYGDLTINGVVHQSFLGGIAGGLSSLRNVYIQNCLNYGTITDNGTFFDGYDWFTQGFTGGIVGESSMTLIDNCVSSGKIIFTDVLSFKKIGSIVGNVNTNANINNTYFTSDTEIENIFGSEKYTPYTANTPNSPAEVSTSLIDILNGHGLDSEWNKWAFNKNNNTVTFKVNNNKGFSVSSQIVLLPDLTPTDPLVFCGWYTDPYYNEEFISNEIHESITLYGLYGEIFTVRFNITGGNVGVSSKKVSVNNPYGTLPTPSRDEAIFEGWFNEKGESVTSDTIFNITNDHVLYAHWTVNSYTITFIFDNGSDPEIRTFEHGSPVIYPDDPMKEDYTFNGWNKSDVNTMPAENLTIMALWTINNYTITFIFDGESGIEMRTFDINSPVTYPDDPVREGYTFNGWNKSDITNMPAENITIAALWIPNIYTLTFDLNGGDSIDKQSINVTFNGTYGDLPTPTKEGYIFNGWFNEKGESVTSDTIVNITSNHILYAQWREIPTSFVEIVFVNKDLSDEEIREIVIEYTKADFDVIRVKDSETGETRIIIKFINTEDAEEFVKSASSNNNNKFERIGFSSKDAIKGSFLMALHPSMIFNFFI